MEILLKKINSSDICKIEQWIKDFEADNYMSRFYPKTFNGKIEDTGVYLWFIIAAGEYDVGTIWVERDTIDTDEATLGIFIGVKDKLGQGIGRIAIRKIIELSVKKWRLKAIKLNVRKDNRRAIKCYESCNFEIVGEGTKLDHNGKSIEFFEMKYEPSLNA